MTSAADGKLRLSGHEGTEELSDKVQRVVVLPTPVVRAVARGAKFTRLPWALVASSSVSVGIAVRTGVREIQVLSSLVAYRIEQATGAPADPQLVEKVAVDLYLNPNRKPDLSDDRLRLVRLPHGLAPWIDEPHVFENVRSIASQRFPGSRSEKTSCRLL